MVVGKLKYKMDICCKDYLQCASTMRLVKFMTGGIQMLKRLSLFGLLVILILTLVLSGCGGAGVSLEAETAAINSLLDRFQSGLATKNTELVVSLCTYPFTWLTQTFNDSADMTNFLNTLFQGGEEISAYEFTERVITVNRNNAAVYAYLQSETASEQPNIIGAVKVTVIKREGTWKISGIENNLKIEEYKINDVLDQFETAMINMDVEALVSLCRFPFSDIDAIHSDEAAMKAAYESKFAQTEIFSTYKIYDREINLNPLSVIASIKIEKKIINGGWYKIDLRYQISMYKEKLEEPWKVLGFTSIQE